MRKKKVYSIILMIVIIISLFNFPVYKSYGINYSYHNTRGQEFIRTLSSSDNSSKEIKKVPYNISFILNNETMNFKDEVLYENNRIYIAISDFIKYFGETEEIDGDNIKVGNIADLDITDKTYYEDNTIKQLRGGIFKKSNDYYISFFDLCEILNLNTFWDYDNNKIYISEKSIEKDVNIKRNSNKKNAYIRFEDFTAGDVYLSKSALEKVRAVVDYMKDENQDFSISWIPRYINHDCNLDNDISKNDSMENSNFIFTLDYIVNRGGTIGLHGYTHQYEDSNSVTGFEFGDGGCTDSEEIRRKVESAITVANNLNIPITYWETPHYRTTADEQKIFEEYFKILYEPAIGVYNANIITSANNEITKYIPTPLGYVDDNTGESMIERIKNRDKNQEFSLFYHLSIEINSIDVSVDNDGNIVCKYDDNSILKNIVNLTDQSGYRFSNINNL
ncbi:DUF2334 domain-containing protein [Clostridium nigeriense]|uniref:DUF2334 domain-containing protein n=1 Tax=Clostridium nigeriense TaxID=1805470 RepID=UPI003D3339C7